MMQCIANDYIIAAHVSGFLDAYRSRTGCHSHSTTSTMPPKCQLDDLGPCQAEPLVRKVGEERLRAPVATRPMPSV